MDFGKECMTKKLILTKKLIHGSDLGQISVEENFVGVSNTYLMLIQDDRVLCKRRFVISIQFEKEAQKLLDDYLKLFDMDKKDIAPYGFKPIKYDVYQFENVKIILYYGWLSKFCKIQIDDFLWTCERFPLIQSPLEYLKIFISEDNNYLRLPSSLRDKLCMM